MKALRMYKPGDLRVEEIPVPSPKEGQVLIKVHACGICGSDIPRINKFGAHISPIIPGHEFSGEIVELGQGVTGFQVGDRVTVPPLIPCFQCKWCQIGEYSLCEHYDYYGSRRDGAMAQYICCEQGSLMKISDRISYEDAATIDPCANAMHALHIADFRAGETIAVYGAGAIGLYALQAAKAMGAKLVISVDISERKMESAKQCGADIAINSMKENAPKRIQELTTGGADLVIDVTGAPAAQINCIESATKMGRVVFLGISHKPLELPENTLDNVLRRQLRIIGSWNSFGAPFPGKDWTLSLQLFDQGKLTSAPVITHRLTLEGGPGIFRQIDDGGLFFNKILFLPWE